MVKEGEGHLLPDPAVTSSSIVGFRQPGERIGGQVPLVAAQEPFDPGDELLPERVL